MQKLKMYSTVWSAKLPINKTQELAPGDKRDSYLGDASFYYINGTAYRLSAAEKFNW